MALIIGNGGSGKGSLELGGIEVGKYLMLDGENSTITRADIPNTAITASGTYHGGIVVNLGKKYSTLAMGNPSQCRLVIYKDDGTLLTSTPSASINISEGVVMMAIWSRDSIRPSFTFTAI